MEAVMRYYFGALGKYARFKGRARRKEFWTFTIFNSIISIILITMVLVNMVQYVSASFEDQIETMDKAVETAVIPIIILFFFTVITLLPSMAVTARRLHDIEYSGWYMLIYLIPLLGVFLLLVPLLSDSDPLPNKYGPCPKQMKYNSLYQNYNKYQNQNDNQYPNYYQNNQNQGNQYQIPNQYSNQYQSSQNNQYNNTNNDTNQYQNNRSSNGNPEDINNDDSQQNKKI